MSELVLSEPKPIKLRRALILGNFYDMEVQIEINQEIGSEMIVETIVGISPDCVLTKSGNNISLSAIGKIYQL